MNINDLIAIIKKKLENKIKIENIEIEDKSFLHKQVYKILDEEMKKFIHSIQILVR